MRRKQRATSEEQAWALLRDQPYYQIASTRPDGHPVLRTLNGVLVDGLVMFHGAFAGEKSECLGRRAVVEVQRVVATIPSYFIDPIKACPATTYYRSAQAEGVLVDVKGSDQKARMLAALMQKYQPEGGHAPFSDPTYEKDLRGVRVFGLQIESVSGKASLGQDRPAERTEKIVRGLFLRGAPGDCEAIEEILETSPTARPAEWIKDCDDRRYILGVHPTSLDAEAHARLLVGQYWRKGSTEAEIQHAIECSTAWVGAFDEAGTLCAAARAVTDQNWTAQICDVVVAEDQRGRGLGSAIIELLLAHPAVRDCRFQKLGTQDAVEFYERFGFRQGGPELPFVTHAMSRMGGG